MEFGITCDINWETRVDKFLDITNSRENSIAAFFDTRNYGEKPGKIFLVLMCRDPELKFKQRKRFSKKDNVLYLDIMLTYDKMINSDEQTRNKIIAQQIIQELPEVIAKYKFPDFNSRQFEIDLKSYFENRKLTNVA